MTDFIAKPKGPKDEYPWRPMDSRERRSAWAVKYYLKFKPGQHQALEQKE